jgi:hypothetical protein
MMRTPQVGDRVRLKSSYTGTVVKTRRPKLLLGTHLVIHVRLYGDQMRAGHKIISVSKFDIKEIIEGQW